MLIKAFSLLPDPRTGPAQRHDLKEMIVMTLSAVLCGADNWVDVAEWASDNEDWLKKYLVLQNGTPSHDTFGRVFRLLDATVFEQCFRSWIADIAGVAQGVIALDGKTLCGSRDDANTALHMVSAFATHSGLCLGQEGTRGKGKEIEGIKALLETLTLKGCTVTIDAIGCQKDIAEKIVAQGGDYLLALKANQGSLFEFVEEFYAEGQRSGFGAQAVSRFETLEKDHGRIETRRHTWVGKFDWMEPVLRGEWKTSQTWAWSSASARSRARSRSSAPFTSAPKALDRPRRWPRQPGATGELKTACTGCSMSCSPRMGAGCAQGTRHAISRRYASSP